MSLQIQLSTGLAELGIEVNETLVSRSLAFLDLLGRWNKVTNLTAITEPEKMVSLHLLDSFAIQPFLSGNRILDVGSGAGLPGIPLAMLNPTKKFVLLDSNGKKTRFLTQAKITLGLDNVEVVQARVRDFRSNVGDTSAEAINGGLFDTIVCRAFGSLDRIIAEMLHLLDSGGTLLAMKGPDQSGETSLVDESRVKLAGIHRIAVPQIEAERFLLALKRC